MYGYEMKEKIKTIMVNSTGTIRMVLQAIDRGGLGVALLVEPGTEKFANINWLAWSDPSRAR